MVLLVEYVSSLRNAFSSSLLPLTYGTTAVFPGRTTSAFSFIVVFASPKDDGTTIISQLLCRPGPVRQDKEGEMLYWHQQHSRASSWNRWVGTNAQKDGHTARRCSGCHDTGGPSF